MKKSDYYEHQIREIEKRIKDNHEIIEEHKSLIKRTEERLISSQERIEVLTEVKKDLMFLKESLKK
ncbi:hypothetical protein [Mammaliicoccus sciuri]|uniref:hypothetical protein n=1 Tax=Mammaliicoccus sciuri TaxID=1296 RepID=UPI0021D32067|nr:hypothetical protein [Mammaliicoccus sciuri]UXV31908.1 hypothetical protein MUA60_13345 [Mammaliicoccus sciuri]